VVQDEEIKARIIAGSALGVASPTETLSKWFYSEVGLDAGTNVPLDADHEERANYVVEERGGHCW
jgi:redox-sensitive bicupin YhaK (pirin superfamily)